MHSLTQNKVKQRIIIANYQGAVRKDVYTLSKEASKERSTCDCVIFMREKDNCAYHINSSGIYEGNTSNTICAISGADILLSNVSDALIFSDRDEIHVAPISSSSNYLPFIIDELKGKKVVYSPPHSVSLRETCPQLSERDISEVILKHYGLKVERVIHSPILRRGLFPFLASNGKTYFLKNRGLDAETIEKVCAFVTEQKTFFPIVYPCIDTSQYTFKKDRYCYGLESFVHGSSFPRNLAFVERVGTKIAEIHASFSTSSKAQFLPKKQLSFNESTLASLIIDLSLHLPEETPFIRTAFSLFPLHLTKLTTLPHQVIHGDLNNSNVLFNRDAYTLIDFESIGIGPRVIDLLSPLIFPGCLKPTNYIAGSLPIVLKSYNQQVNNIHQINSLERALAPSILMSELLRTFVVQTIRRGRENFSLSQLKEDLTSLEGYL